MRAATQAAWLQVVAPREQLDIGKALGYVLVITLCDVLICNPEQNLASDTTLAEQRNDESHLVFSCKMGIILDKLFGGGAPVVESTLDTAGSCQSKCCDTEVISEVSSSSSEHTHASHHAHSGPSFETLKPGYAETAKT